MAAKTRTLARLPQATGINAATRHHTRALSSYKVKKDPYQVSEHTKALGLLADMAGSHCGQSCKRVLKDLYLALSVAQADLLNLLPRALLTPDNTLDIAAVMRVDRRSELCPEYQPAYSTCDEHGNWVEHEASFSHVQPA